VTPWQKVRRFIFDFSIMRLMQGSSDTRVHQTGHLMIGDMAMQPVAEAALAQGIRGPTSGDSTRCHALPVSGAATTPAAPPSGI
jgi:hypothetical protein